MFDLSSQKCQNAEEGLKSITTINANYIGDPIPINITSIDIPKCFKNSTWQTSWHYLKIIGDEESYITGFLGESDFPSLVDAKTQDFHQEFCMDNFYSSDNDVSR